MESAPSMYTQTRLSKRGSTYYFRAMIPKPLQAHFGKKEIVYSLRTKDRQEASRLVRQASAKLDAEFEAIQKPIKPANQQLTVLDEATVGGICDLWRYQCLEGDVWYRIQGFTDDEYEQRQADHAQTIESLREILAKGRLERIQPALSQFLALISVEFCGDPEDQRKLAWTFLEAVIDTHLAVMQRDHGEVVATPPAPHIRIGKKTESLVPQGRAGSIRGKTLKDCFELWKDRRANRPQKTVAAYWAALEGFISFAGTKVVSDYSEECVYAYIDNLLKQGEHDPHTIAKNIGFLRSIFNAAKKRLKLSGNPFSEIEVPGLDVYKVRRLPLSHDDLKTLFASTVFQQSGMKRGGGGAAAYWLPLLSLFTGARLEELGQLYVTDVKREKGIWYLDITDIIENDVLKQSHPKRLKSPSARRNIPLHPQLIQTGFLDYLAAIKAEKHTRLFPLLKADCKGDITGNFSKWWSRYRRRIGVGSKLKTFHSFRHTFKDAMREAEIDVMVANRLMGHKDDSMGGHYGLGHSLRVLDLAMKKIDYPDLVIPSYKLLIADHREKRQ